VPATSRAAVLRRSGALEPQAQNPRDYSPASHSPSRDNPSTRRYRSPLRRGAAHPLTSHQLESDSWRRKCNRLCQQFFYRQVGLSRGAIRRGGLMNWNVVKMLQDCHTTTRVNHRRLFNGQEPRQVGACLRPTTIRLRMVWPTGNNPRGEPH